MANEWTDFGWHAPSVLGFRGLGRSVLKVADEVGEADVAKILADGGVR